MEALLKLLRNDLSLSHCPYGYAGNLSWSDTHGVIKVTFSCASDHGWKRWLDS